MTPEAAERALLPDGRRRAAARLPGLQALPARRRRPARRSGTSAATSSARAMRLIADGVVDREGVGGLAGRLGYSERHLDRLRRRRARRRAARARPRPARPDRPPADRDDRPAVHRRRVRRRVREHPPVQRHRPRGVRDVAHRAARARRRAHRPAPAAASGEVPLRLPARAPFAADAAARLPRRPRRARRRGAGDGDDVPPHARPAARPRASVTLRPRRGPRARRRSRLADVRDLRRRRCRAAAGCSTSTPTRSRSTTRSAPTRCSARSSRATPGRRVPGAVDGAELAVRAVLGQQVSVAGARTLAGRLVAAPASRSTLDVRDSPTCSRRRGARRARPGASARCPRPRGARSAELCAAIADGDVELDAGRRPRRRPRPAAGTSPASGRGPPRTSPCAPSATPTRSCPPTSACATRCDRLGVDGSPRSAAAIAERWRPWRSYALHHLWGSLRLLEEDLMTMLTRPHTIDSPIGTLTLVVSDDGVRALLMEHRVARPDRTRRASVAVGRPPAARRRRRTSSTSTSPATAPTSTCRSTRSAPTSSCGRGRRCARSPTARRSATASRPAGSATRARPAPSAPPTARTRSASSCPATA